jgi:hypothetical protein
MKNNEIEQLLIQPKDIFRMMNEDGKKFKNYLVENYLKKPDILLIYLKGMGGEKLISISENIEFLHRILSNKVFFNYFKKSNLSVDDLIKILTICNNSSDYFINRIKNKEEIINKKIKKLEGVFNNFIDNTKELYDFELWFNERSIKNLAEILNFIAPNEINKDEELINLEIGGKIESLVIFKKIFENYYQDVKNIYENERDFNSKEKNININYFVRELINIFESTNKIKIPSFIIIELVAIIFDRHLDDTQIKNIIKNSNKHPANTIYIKQIITKENDVSRDVEYIKIKEERPIGFDLICQGYKGFKF